jgi:hypothetical protein
MVADLDSDGEQDIIVWDDSKLMIFDKNLNEIKNETVGELAGHFTVVDFDGDSSVDDIVAIVVNNDTTANFTVFSFDGASISTNKNFILEGQSLGTNYKVANIKCANFDSDSDLDCLYSDWKGIAHSYDNGSTSDSDDDLNLNVSMGGYCPSEDACYNTAPSFEDYDDDGDLDAMFIHVYKPASNIAEVSYTIVDENNNTLQVDLDDAFVNCNNPGNYFSRFADVSGDSKSEVVVIQHCTSSGSCAHDRYSNLAVYNHTGSLVFSKSLPTVVRTLYDTGCNGAVMKDPLILDFDDDGKEDIQILYSSYNHISGSPPNWFTRYNLVSYNGTGTTLSSSSIEIPYPEKDYIMKSRGATFADMDGDGEYDWITPGGILSQESEIISNFSLTTSSIVYSPIPVDVDGNNLLDLVWSEDYKTKLLKPSPVQIIDFRVAQVVEDVDLVKDKNTLVRLNVKFFGNESNQTNVDINLYLNGSLEDSDSITLNGTEDENVSLWFTPDVAGTDLEIKAVAVNNFTGTNLSSTKIMCKDVIETRGMDISIVAVDSKSSSFSNTIYNNTEFMNLTYPFSNVDLRVSVNDDIFYPSIGSTLEPDEEQDLLREIYREGRISGYSDRVVGVVPSGWFEEHESSGLGYAYFGPFGAMKAVIIEEGYRHGFAHELGHTFRLCEEYSSSDWEYQNDNLFIVGGCPNGDIDDNGELDSFCVDSPTGCDVSTLGELVPFVSDYGEANLYNFMGSANSEDERWVSGETYGYLLDELSSPLSFLTTEFSLLVTGTITKAGIVELDNTYVLDEQSVLNETSSGENFSIVLDSNGDTVYQLDFEPSFFVTRSDGNFTESNVSSFAFVIPFFDNSTRLSISENLTLKDEINRTENTPTINITNPLGNEVYSNQLFNITWNASDLDGDDLFYAILFSIDNGSNYTTLEMDYNETVLEVNSSDLEDCGLCRIKVLVTDGMNTNSSVSNPFSIDNDLQINNASVIYSNDTERVFKFDINNTFHNVSVNNISWSLDLGETIINSTNTMDLIGLEEAFVYVYYNYTVVGNYTVVATVYNENYVETKDMGVEVI